MKTCYTVSKPGMMMINQGVFTNMKILYETIIAKAKETEASISFLNAMRYDKRKFTYTNLNTLLNNIMLGESFCLKLTSSDNRITIFEITYQQFNKL